jgi:hypothetical protein
VVFLLVCLATPAQSQYGGDEHRNNQGDYQAGLSELRVGDIVFALDRCVLQNGATTVANLPKGAQLRVVRLNGDWVGCSALVDGKEVGGWIREALVTKSPQAESTTALGPESTQAPSALTPWAASWSWGTRGGMITVLGAAVAALIAIVTVAVRISGKAGPTQKDAASLFTPASDAGDEVLGPEKAPAMKVDEAVSKGAGIFFLCGTLLILTGAGLLYLFATVGFEHQLGDNAHNHLSLGLLLAAIVTAGLTVVGFFVSKKGKFPIWYGLISGVIPGFLLLSGWNAIHDGFAQKRGSQVAGLRGIVILTVIVALLDTYIAYAAIAAVAHQPAIRSSVCLRCSTPKQAEDNVYRALQSTHAYNSPDLSLVVSGLDGRRLLGPRLAVQSHGSALAFICTAEEAELRGNEAQNSVRIILRNGIMKTGGVAYALGGVQEFEIPLKSF